MTPIEIAVKFAQLGYLVFPLYKGKNGVRSQPYGWSGNIVSADKLDKVIPATSDTAVVEAWAEQVRRKYKSEVIGFGILGDGCVIIDLDNKDGKNGSAEFSALAKKHSVPDPVMITRTKSNGFHLFYGRPTKYQNSYIKSMANILIGRDRYEGIDLRGNGGFVVGPEFLVDDLRDAEQGRYSMKSLTRPSELPLFPDKVLGKWVKTVTDDDLDRLTVLANIGGDDLVSAIHRGVFPEFVPKGSRNGSFFALISHMRFTNPIEVTRAACEKLAERVEEPETLSASVDLEKMLASAYGKEPGTPQEVAQTLIDAGLYQLTGFKGKLHYVILEDNPFISSRNPHDEMSMKTLLKRYEKGVENEKGKVSVLNPITVITKIITDDHRTDMIGFKPKSGDVFTLSDESGAKRFLNTYNPITIPVDYRDVEEDVWAEFVLLMTRLFGDEDSEDYQLGMDFMAWIIQHPQIKPCIAPFLMSVNRGVGKSLLFNVIASVMGTNKVGDLQARMVKLDEISGRFFDPSGCVINMIDEVQFSVHRNMRSESTAFWRHLKNLITAETVSVEIKGGMTYQCPNTAAVALAGNFGSFFPIEEFDRRIWIIDNNPPLLVMGTVDRLFDLVRRTGLKPSVRYQYVSTIRYELMKWKIKNDLSSMRAPMTDTKQELYENTLTDSEEWFVKHFKDPGNLFAFSAVVSQSAMEYVWTQCGRSEMRDSETFFRDLKRKGHIRPIRFKSGVSTSKQFTAPTIGMDGTMIKMDRRELLYTTRDHGSYDGASSEVVLEQFSQNCATIMRWKQRVMFQKRDQVVSGAMTGL
jgi:hypothetical protein